MVFGRCTELSSKMKKTSLFSFICIKILQLAHQMKSCKISHNSTSDILDGGMKPNSSSSSSDTNVCCCDAPVECLTERQAYWFKTP